MKIAMVGQFPPHYGGVGVHIHSLAKELVSQGHEVYVITYPHKELKDIDGIHVIGAKSIGIPGLRSLLFEKSAEKALKELVEKEDIDIIHGHYLFPAGYAAVKIGNEYNIPTYVTAHGSDMFELYQKQAYIRPIIKKVLEKADKVIAVSNALKDEILATDAKNISNKLRVYYNYVDTSKFQNNGKDDFRFEFYNLQKPIVLFVGNIIKRKNVNALLEAKKISETDYLLVIVGEGPLLKDLKRKVDEEEIPDVVFTGARDDVENIIPSAEMLILPSFSESFGLVLIEALSCGVPVIGSDVGGISEIITEDVGLLIDSNDYVEISVSIDELIENVPLRNHFKANARNRAKFFSKLEIPYDELR
ncbi:MAG: glycosyltransferase family 4 protein [archaeon]|nr:glycosyltransferase family 4 protein [archaeon]